MNCSVTPCLICTDEKNETLLSSLQDWEVFFIDLLPSYIWFLLLERKVSDTMSYQSALNLDWISELWSGLWCSTCVILGDFLKLLGPQFHDLKKKGCSLRTLWDLNSVIKGKDLDLSCCSASCLLLGFPWLIVLGEGVLFGQRIYFGVCKHPTCNQLTYQTLYIRWILACDYRRA